MIYSINEFINLDLYSLNYELKNCKICSKNRQNCYKSKNYICEDCLIQDISQLLEQHPPNLPGAGFSI